MLQRKRPASAGGAAGAWRKERRGGPLRIVSGDELHALESALSPEAVAALYAPTSAIVCPFAMTIALAENAAQNGVEFFMDTPVTAITCRNGLYEITAGGRILQARTVVNAARVIQRRPAQHGL